MKAQRLRIIFARGDEMKYISPLDMMRFWERALRRAQQLTPLQARPSRDMAAIDEIFGGG